MKNSKLSPCLIWLQLLISSLCLCLMFCTGDNKISGTEISNEDAVCLVGKVLDMKGQGVSGIVASIDNISLSDTTDIAGRYSLILTKKELINQKINLDTLDSSVQITNSGNIVSTIKITKWIDSLPSVFLVQRNISGKLSTSDADLSRIAAVISKLDADRNVLEQFTKELWLNIETMGYSGFCYISNSTSNQNFSVYVNVYNSDSVLTGKSKTVYFNQLAGDIEIPSFDPYSNPELQISAGKDTTLTIRDTLHLAASLISGSVAKWEWNIDGSGFVQTSGSDTIIILPDDSTNVTCTVKATDKSGYVATSSINIECINDVPRLNSVVYPTGGVLYNKTAKIRVSGYDRSKISKWEWDIGNIKYEKTDSTLSNEDGFTLYYSAITFIMPDSINNIDCSVRLTDDDGNTASDTVTICPGVWKAEKNLESGLHIPYAFSQNEDYYTWGYFNEATSPESVTFYKSDFEKTYIIGSVPVPYNYSMQSCNSCISRDGTIYAAAQYDQYIEMYQCRDSVFDLIPAKIPVSGNVTSLIMESSGNDIFIGAVLDGNRYLIYKYNGNDFDTVDPGINNAGDRLLITKAEQNGIYICGKYTDENDSSRYFIKKYTNGILSDICSGLNIKEKLVSILYYSDNLFFGIAENASYTMHSGIFTSYLCKYSDNSIEKFGGYLGLCSQNKICNLFQRKGDLYALVNSSSTGEVPAIYKFGYTE